MRLTANNVQWIKAPVWSRDNSDENTAKRLPPTMQFKAIRRVGSGWRALSAWLILGLWQIVSLHATAATVTLWSKQSGFTQSVSGGNRVDLSRDEAGVTIAAVLSYLGGGHVELLMLLETHLKGGEVMFEVCRVCVGGQQTVSAENMRGRLLFRCKQAYKVRLRLCLTHWTKRTKTFLSLWTICHLVKTMWHQRNRNLRTSWANING